MKEYGQRRKENREWIKVKWEEERMKNKEIKEEIQWIKKR